MINTFNLEQNLLTFPSERDILTGGRGGVSAMEDGWLDGRPLTCPRVSVHAAALPAPMSQATQGERNWRNRVWPPQMHNGQRGPMTQWTLSCIRDSGKHYPTDH